MAPEPENKSPTKQKLPEFMTSNPGEKQFILAIPFMHRDEQLAKA